ncbi:hypothetical protein WJ30_19055 [Burkholderia diffusa]|nr:hypothetical protein WJ30_19055 [Burkholderia diffusa]
MNQGKKSVAHRSTPFETQIRRVLHAPGSTICGAVASDGAGRPAGRRTSGNRGAVTARHGSPARGSAAAFLS